IISSIARDEPFFTKEKMTRLAGLTYKYLIDLSVPRSVAPDVEEVPGVVLYNIDTIRSKADEALTKRIAAIPHVKSIIEEAVEDFNDWSKEMIVSPTIQKLKGALEQIRQEEMARYMKNMTEEEAAKIDRITASMMQKIIKLPV